ncbi:MAG TPA: hypothetical protein VF461_10810 [Gemmatimonadaceae bacterium]
MTTESATRSAVPRSRARLVAQRVGLVAQVVIAAAGAFGLWAARAEGQPVSRPSAIAFWAGVAGLVASIAGPRIRARMRSRRRTL